MLKECCEWVLINHMMCVYEFGHEWVTEKTEVIYLFFFLFLCFVLYITPELIQYRIKSMSPDFCFIIPSDSTCVCIILHKLGDEVIAHAGYHTSSFHAFPPFSFSSVKQSALWKEGVCSQPCLPCPVRTNSTEYTLAHHTQGQAQTT